MYRHSHANTTNSGHDLSQDVFPLCLDFLTTKKAGNNYPSSPPAELMCVCVCVCVCVCLYMLQVHWEARSYLNMCVCLYLHFFLPDLVEVVNHFGTR